MCLGHYGVGLVCVSKVTNMTCNLLWTRQEVTEYSTQEPSYCLHSPDIGQLATCLPQREPNYNSLDSLDQTACILQTIAKSQPASSDESQITTSILLSLYPLNRSQVMALDSRQKSSYSLTSSCKTGAKSQPAFLYSCSTCILQTVANIQPASRQ